MEGLIVTINRVSPLILRKVGGAKTWFFWGGWVHYQPPPSKISGPKPPLICTHGSRPCRGFTTMQRVQDHVYCRGLKIMQRVEDQDHAEGSILD